VTAVNRAADAALDALRVSLDAKATVKIGPFSRKGRSRVPTAAADHDFQPEGTVTPVGLLLPELDKLFLYGVTSRVTSDCLVDRLVQWWEAVRARFAHITTLVLNLDNGPENHSHRTQFVARLVRFVADYGLTVRLAYYPPYHSKYNPVERCWGILEQHWNGTLLDAARHRPVLRRHDDLERHPAHGRPGDDHLRAQRDPDQRGNGVGGSATHPAPHPGQVIRRHPPATRAG